jgi:hypothetical protein
MRQTSESPAGSLTLKIGSVGGLLKEALYEAMHTVDVREPASKAMLFGRVQVHPSNRLRGSNPFCDA